MDSSPKKNNFSFAAKQKRKKLQSLKKTFSKFKISKNLKKNLGISFSFALFEQLFDGNVLFLINKFNVDNVISFYVDLL